MSTSVDEALKTILDDQELEYERPRAGAYLVKLPGQHKLATMTWLVAGDHSLHVEAFFCRRPDENFDRALELGFAGSIQREWDWRVKRGESLANLEPFARILPDTDADTDAGHRRAWRG